VILNYLRTGTLHVPEMMSYERIQEEADYYMIPIPRRNISNTAILKLVNAQRNGSGLQLPGLGLDETNFKMFSIKCSNFTHSSMRGANLEGCAGESSNFHAANLEGGSRFRDCLFLFAPLNSVICS